ncbi:MAG: aminoglycoside phosphotransferase family protein [Clostridia bacterium]|nr:aminoglycoside phosphotransferase family protein [Clostridia bacterium]
MGRVLFTRRINDWKDWSGIFTDTEAFYPLAEAIFMKTGIPFSGLTGLAPGTNAVFRSGDYVIKIFAPPESGITGSNDGEREIRLMEAAGRKGISVPKIISRGTVNDLYDFNYYIMSYIEGTMLGDLYDAEKSMDKGIIRELHDLVITLRQIGFEECDRLDPVRAAVENERLDLLSPELRKSFILGTTERLSEEYVCCHGDLTGENIIVGKNGISLLDFGDAIAAPRYYEYPALFIEGLRADRDACRYMASLLGERDILKAITSAFCLHEFAPDLLKTLCRKTGSDISGLRSIEDVSHLLEAIL